jgi:hypothetical protein
LTGTISDQHANEIKIADLSKIFSLLEHFVNYHEYFFLLILFGGGFSVAELRNVLSEKFPLDIVDKAIETMENRFVFYESIDQFCLFL